MKNILLFSLFIFLYGCSDDNIDDQVERGSGSVKTAKTVNSTNEGNVVSGLHYDLDSVNRYAIISCNEVKIMEIADQFLENIIKKNKKLEFKNDLQEAYGFYLTPESWDSLATLDYHQADFSYDTDNGDNISASNKDINLSGRPPYSGKGLWEDIKFNNTGMLSKHPRLYKKAVDRFFTNENPKISEVTITNQGGSFVDYSIKVNYNFSVDQYIYYTISNTTQKIMVTIDKFGMK